MLVERLRFGRGVAIVIERILTAPEGTGAPKAGRDRNPRAAAEPNGLTGTFSREQTDVTS